MTLRSILVPLDGSALAEQALRPALLLAKAAGARIRLVLVHQLPPAPTTRDQRKLYTSIEVATRRSARDYLLRQMAALKQKGFTSVSRVVITGKPGPGIVQHAGEWDASLVVMSTHGRGPVERAWLGSVADYVIRHARVPVLLARPVAEGVRELARGKRILVPLDGSRFAEAALGPAAEFARVLDSALQLMEIVRPMQTVMAGPMGLVSGYDEPLSSAWHDQAREYLARTAARLEAEELGVEWKVAVSPTVAGAIVDAAAKERAGLIALATHGRGGVKRFFLGGVADKVVRSANCPVLVCPRVRGSRSSRS